MSQTGYPVSVHQRLFCFAILLACGCHREPETRGPDSEAAAVAFDAPIHFKSGGRAIAGDVTFTVRLLPKLMISGPQPEVEQAQIECTRGSEHGVIQVDTLHKSAEWGGITFDLDYADVYHDDVKLKVRRK